MPDWTQSMQQTYEYYVVDPNTWKDKQQLTNIKSCTITRDADVETLGSATIDSTNSVGECYIRVYLVTIQNGLRERHPLGTFLVQTPSSTYNGRVRNVSMDAYTPLLELKESPPPLGYSKLEGENIMTTAYQLIREHARAPVVPVACDKKLHNDFISNTSDTWLTFISDLIANADYHLDLDELGRILFAPKQDTVSLQPVWTFTDDNSSILYPELTMDHDLYGIPNIVDVVYSDGIRKYTSRVINDDGSSPTSIANRGREIVYRVTNPSLSGVDDAVSIQKRVDEYAKTLLREVSSIEYTINYSHAYCPVRVGDCVRLNYTRAGITNTNAKIVSQSIRCGVGCQITEKAVYTKKLWG